MIEQAMLIGSRLSMRLERGIYHDRVCLLPNSNVSHLTINGTLAIRRSPRKSEKKPVYVLNISITPDEVDNFLDPAKNIIQLRVSWFEKI